jgi:hypothetical protein
MKSEIIIRLPTSAMQARDLLNFLGRHIDEFVGALDLDTRHLPIRAEILEISLVEIEQFDCGMFRIEYEYDWEAFSPCEDEWRNGTCSGLLVSTVVRGENAYFELFVAPPQRNTVDEF